MPFECAFFMLKNRFTFLKEVITLCHEDDISYFCLTLLLLHNLLIKLGDMKDHYLSQDESVEDELVIVETSKGNIQWDALLYYAIESLGKIY